MFDFRRETVSDNGVGKKLKLSEKPAPAKTGGGLGTAVVTALVRQLGAQIKTDDGGAGTTVAITRARIISRPQHFADPVLKSWTKLSIDV
jgi:two-component sensor histidine kinase